MSTQVINARPEGSRSRREPPSPQGASLPRRGLRERPYRTPRARGTELSARGWGQHRGRCSVRCGRGGAGVGCGQRVPQAACEVRSGLAATARLWGARACLCLPFNTEFWCISGVQNFSRNLIKIPNCFSLKHEGISHGCFSLGCTIFHLLWPG